MQQTPAEISPEQVCVKYALEPMSDAMNEIWTNMQNLNFVCAKKRDDCDATLCYKHPGPADSDNEPTADFHTFTQVPLSVVHNKTETGDTVCCIEAFPI